VEGRFVPGLIVEIFSLSASALDHYINSRATAILESGWADVGLIFVGSGGDASVAAIYETERWDMEDFADSALGWPNIRPDHREIRQITYGVFRRCGPSVRPERSGFTTPSTASKAVTGLLVSTTDCLAAGPVARQELGAERLEWDYNNWFNRKRMPAEVALGYVATGYRYADTRVKYDRRVFLALYEVAEQDVCARLKSQLEQRDHLDPPPPGVRSLSDRTFTFLMRMVPRAHV
jgi:hypothetical protein